MEDLVTGYLVYLPKSHRLSMDIRIEGGRKREHRSAGTRKTGPSRLQPKKYGVDFDEVFVPVAKKVTIGTLLLVASLRGMFVKHMHLTTAYLHG